MEKIYYSANEIATMLGVSRSYAYKLIKQLNLQLEKEGYIAVRGRISSAYFKKKYFGLAGNQ